MERPVSEAEAASKVLFITGAGAGIGAETARAAVRAGHRVALADLDEAGLGETARAVGEAGHALRLDIRDPAAWEEALATARSLFGRVDVLLNNAGVHAPGFLLDQPEEQLVRMAEVNLLGLAHGLRAGARFFLEQGSGHLITMSSQASFVPLKGQAFYSATKHGARALHYAAAMELADAPIRMTIIHPGAVDTGMVDRQVGHKASALTFAEPLVPPEKVAETVLRAIDRPGGEFLVPGHQAFFVRLLGVFPGLLNLALKGAWARGEKTMNARRAKGRA